MPKVVVRKSYRCQPGKRREVLAALQGLDVAAAEVGYPRGRYLFVETRNPGDPDLEVEFAFESYAEMDQLEQRMRQHVARAIRDGAPTGQDLQLEPSATRYLLLLDDGTAGNATRAQGSTGESGMTGAAAASATAGRTPAARPQPGLTAGRDGGQAGRDAGSSPARPPGAPPAAAQTPPPRGSGPARAPRDEPPPFEEEEEPDELFRGEDVPEPDVPPPPDVPEGMTEAQFRAAQLARARSALTNAEQVTGMGGRPGGLAGLSSQGPRRPARQQPADGDGPGF